MILHATTEHEDHHKLGSRLKGATVVCKMSSNWQRESKTVPLFSSSKKEGTEVKINPCCIILLWECYSVSRINICHHTHTMQYVKQCNSVYKFPWTNELVPSKQWSSCVCSKEKLTLSLWVSRPSLSKSLKSTEQSFCLQLFLLNISIIIIIVQWPRWCTTTFWAALLRIRRIDWAKL